MNGPEVWPGSVFDTVTVYLLCGHKRYTRPNGQKVWMHYTGATGNLEKRIFQHRNGTSRAKLPQAMRAQGIRLRLARTWRFEVADQGWKFEKQLKRAKNAATHCPYCCARFKKKKAASQRKLAVARKKAATRRK